MPLVTLACQAMATRFELVAHGADVVALRAAGEEALGEIENLEDRLSLYRPASEISHVNARAAREPVRVSPEVFNLLRHAQQLHRESGGVFDITVAPLVRCWGFMGGTGRLPTPEAVAEARSVVGMSLVELDPTNFTIRFARPGVMLDLGAIGKGYAVEKAAEILREAGVESALLHGGTSTACAIGHPPDADTWQIAISAAQAPTLPEAPEHPLPPPLAVVRLRDESLSVSAVWGRAFEAEGKTYGHVIDPRTGYPTQGATLSAVVLPSATETDALSTALLTLGMEGLDRITSLRPGMKALVANREAGQWVCVPRL